MTGRHDERALICKPNTLPQVAAVGECWDNEQARVLLAGVDTLYFSFAAEVTDDVWDRLEIEQQKARDLADERKAVYCSDWLNAKVSPTGARGGYRFLIETDTWSIKLLKGIPNRPPIYVEMRSYGLHTHSGGVVGACDEVCQYIRDVLLSDWDHAKARAAINLDAAKCSRLDLHCDWQGGWHPTYETGEDRQFIKPGRVKWKPEMDGNRCTGYTFGRDTIQARIYNKTLQTAVAHIDWYAELLTQRNGLAYNPAVDVWRFEAELKREGVKGFKLYAKPELDDDDTVIESELAAEDLPTISSVRKALHWAGTLFDYMTRHWLRLVTPTADPNRARWPLHPTWAVIQAGFAHATQGQPMAEPKLQLVRGKRFTGYGRLLHRMQIGVLTAWDAAGCDASGVLVAWLEHVQRITQLIRAQHEDAERDQPSQKAHIAKAQQLDRMEQFIAMSLGIFTSAGVLKAELPPVAEVADLVTYLLDDLDRIATSKGGIGRLLIEKRCKVFKVAPGAIAEMMAA